MGKISKIFLSVCCILPLIGLIAFAEEETPSVVPAEPVLEDKVSHIDDVYVPGFVYVYDLTVHRIFYNNVIGFNIVDNADVNVGDVVVIYAPNDVGYLFFDVVATGQGTASDRTVLTCRETIESVEINSEYYLQVYNPIDPLNFVSLIGDWIIGCFGTVALVLTGFATDNEWVTLFLLVVPLSGLIFAFVKSLIARR